MNTPLVSELTFFMMTKVGEEPSEILTPGTKYVVIGCEPGNQEKYH